MYRAKRAKIVVEILESIVDMLILGPMDLMMKIMPPALRVSVFVLTLPLTFPIYLVVMVVIIFPMMIIITCIEVITEIYTGEF